MHSIGHISTQCWFVLKKKTSNMATASSDLPEIKNILTKLENNIGIACQQISGEIINLLSSYYYGIGKKKILIYVQICHYLSSKCSIVYLIVNVFIMLNCVLSTAFNSEILFSLKIQLSEIFK